MLPIVKILKKPPDACIWGRLKFLYHTLWYPLSRGAKGGTVLHLPKEGTVRYLPKPCAVWSVANLFHLQGGIHMSSKFFLKKSKWFIALFACFLFFTQAKEALAISCNFTITPEVPKPSDSNLSFLFTSNEIGDALGEYAIPGDLKIYLPESYVVGNLYDCGPYPVGHIADDRHAFDGRPLRKSIGYWWTGALGVGCRSLFNVDSIHKVELRYNDNTPALCEGEYIIDSVPATCDVKPSFTGKGDVDDTSWKITVENIQKKFDLNYVFTLIMDENIIIWTNTVTTAKSGIEELILPEYRTAGTHTIVGTLSLGNFSGKECGRSEFEITKAGDVNVCADKAAEAKEDCSDKFKKCFWCPESSSVGKIELIDLCNQLPIDTASDKTGSINYSAKCRECANRSAQEKVEAEARGEKWKEKAYIWTAIGCIPTDFTSVINDYVFKYGIGIAGGIAFLRFLYGCFLILTSSGNSETVEESRAIIMSALAGLFLIIFSVFFLRTVGVDIFQIPGWGPERPSSSSPAPPAFSCPANKPVQCGNSSVCCARTDVCEQTAYGAGWYCATCPINRRCGPVCCPSGRSCKVAANTFICSP